MTKSRGWVLYDGSCGFCSSWVARWQKLLASRGFAIAPLQEDWVREKTGLTEENLLKDIQLLLVDGKLVSGSAAYLYVMKTIWWLWPFAMLFSIPGLRQVFDKCYRTFNRNRYAISKTCKLNG